MRLIQTLAAAGLASAIVVKDAYNGAGISGNVRVRRQVDVIKGVFSTISTDVEALSTTIKGFSGDAGALTSASSTLISDLKAGTTKVEGSEPVDLSGATQIAQFVTGLQSAIQTTITDLINIKPKLVAAGQGPTVLQSLQDQKTAATAFADAVIKKTPSALQSVAQQLSGGITAAIQSGIDAFQDQAGASPPSGGSAPAASSPASAAPTSDAASSTHGSGSDAHSTPASQTVASTPVAATTAAAPTVPKAPKASYTTGASAPAQFTGSANAAAPAMGLAALAAAGLVAVM